MQVSRLAELILFFWKLFHEFSPSLITSAFRLAFFCSSVAEYVRTCAGWRRGHLCLWISVRWRDYVPVDRLGWRWFRLGLILNDLSDFTRIVGAQPSALSFSVFLPCRRPLVVVIGRRLPLRISPLTPIGWNRSYEFGTAKMEKRWMDIYAIDNITVQHKIGWYYAKMR